MIFRKITSSPLFSFHFLEKLSLSSFSIIYDFLYGRDVLKDFCCGQGITKFKRRLRHQRNYVILLDNERCKQIFLQSIALSGGCQRSRNTNNSQGMRAIARVWRACACACSLRRIIAIEARFSLNLNSVRANRTSTRFSNNIKIFYSSIFLFLNNNTNFNFSGIFQ